MHRPRESRRKVKQVGGLRRQKPKSMRKAKKAKDRADAEYEGERVGEEVKPTVI